MYEFSIMIGHFAWAMLYAFPLGDRLLLPGSWVARFQRVLK